MADGSSSAYGYAYPEKKPTKQNKARAKTMEVMKKQVLPILGRLAPGRSPDFYLFILTVLKDMDEYFPTEDELVLLIKEIDTAIETFGSLDVIRSFDVYKELLPFFREGLENEKDTTLRFANSSKIRNFFANKEPSNVGAQPNQYVTLEREKGPIPRIPANELQRQNMNWRQQYAQEQQKLRYNRYAGRAQNFVPTPISLNQARSRAIVAEHQAIENMKKFKEEYNNAREPNGMDPAIERKEHLRVAPAKGALKRPPGGAAAPRKTRRGRRRSL